MHKSSKVLLAAIIYGIVSLGSGPLSGTASAQTKTLEEIVAWVNNNVISKSE